MHCSKNVVQGGTLVHSDNIRFMQIFTECTGEGHQTRVGCLIMELFNSLGCYVLKTYVRLKLACDSVQLAVDQTQNRDPE